MGEKRVPLGGEPSVMPAPQDSEPPEEGLMARLRQLVDLGKL